MGIVCYKGKASSKVKDGNKKGMQFDARNASNKFEKKRARQATS
jgi:hypothetical protein